MTPPQPYSISIHSHIDEIAPEDWDAFLHPDDLQATHCFVKACQDAEMENTEFRHFILRDKAGPACVASFSLFPVLPELLAPSPGRRAMQRIRKRLQGFMVFPILFCGLPVSFGSSCLRIRSDLQSAPVIAVLEEVLKDMAADLKASLVCFKEFREEERGSVADLPSHGYFEASSLPGCSLPIHWNTFDDYLADMRSEYRRQVRATLRMRHAAGLRFRIEEDFHRFCPEIFALYEQVMDRAEYQMERLNLKYFERLNHSLGPQAKALIVDYQGKMAAVGILLYGPRVMTFLLAGIDYARNRECQAYINLVTEIVSEAIRTGADCLELGQTSYHLKQRLGGQTQSRFFYLQHRRPLVHRIFRSASGILFPSNFPAPRRVFREGGDQGSEPLPELPAPKSLR